MQSSGTLSRPVLDGMIRGICAVMDLEDAIGIIPLGGREACTTDQVTEDWFIKAVGGTGCTHDVLFHHDRTHVVGAPGERNLSDMRAHGDPTGADGMNVVQVQSRDGLGAKVITCS